MHACLNAFQIIVTDSSVEYSCNTRVVKTMKQTCQSQCSDLMCSSTRVHMPSPAHSSCQISRNTCKRCMLTRAPDEHAQNNNVECLAQDMVVFLYYLWKPSFFQNPCLSQQVGFVSALTVSGVQSYKSSVGESCTLTHQLSHVLCLAVCSAWALIVCNGLSHIIVG